MNRRTFSKTLASLLFIATGGLMGCPKFGTIEADIQAYVPFILQAVAGILTIVDPPLGLMLQPLIVIVNASIAALVKLIADWKADDAQQKPGAVGDIIAGLEATEQDLQNVLAAVKVNAPAPVYLGILALVNILLGVLEGFVNKLQAQAAPAVQTRLAARKPAAPALHLTSSQFRTTWNAKCDEVHWSEAKIK